MIWWPFFFIRLLQAGDLTVEKYCFHTPDKMERAFAQLQTITVPSDRAMKEGTCFIMNALPHRRELIQKYLLSNNPDMLVSFSSESIKRESCELQVERASMKSTKSDLAEVTLNSGKVDSTFGGANISETFHITTLKEFELRVNHESIQGECRHLTPHRYEITLTLQKPSVLKTQVHLERGQKLELARIIKELRNKSHATNTVAPEVRWEANERNNQEMILLSIR